MISSTKLLAGRYLLGPLIGQGGMSDVYQAADQDSGAAVAVKIVRSGDPEFARRLAQEVRALQRIEDPGLVRMIDTGVEDDQAYLVMELVEGPTLAVNLRGGPIGPAGTAAVGAGLASALAHVHAQGIVHRDVKPSNILLGPDRRARLGDFGIARLLDGSTFTIDGTTLGTAAYMAPEQLEDHEVGPSADIWSLGIVLLECLIGRRVYEGTTSEIIARRLAGPVPLPADLPVPWKLVLSGMLDHRPDQRLTGGEVASLLSAPAFTEPWAPSPSSKVDQSLSTVPMDLTALASRSALGDAATTAAPATTAMATSSGDTRIAPPPPPPPVDEAALAAQRRRRWMMTVATVAIACAVLGLVLARVFGSNGPAAAGSQSSTTTTVARTTTTTAPTTTTTTAPPTAPTELAALVSDVVSGMDAGTISQGVGQNIESQAQQAVTDEAAGKPQQAASDLQQAATTIAKGEQQGAIASAEATALQGALNALAGTLGLSGAATVTTTTAPAGPPGGPGGGPGGGKKGNH